MYRDLPAMVLAAGYFAVLLVLVETLRRVFYVAPDITRKIFLMGTRGQQEVLIALDEANGEELWFLNIGPVFENGWGDGPRGTPTADRQHVYALGAQGNLV